MCFSAFQLVGEGGDSINCSEFAIYISSASLFQLGRLMNCNCFLATVGRRYGDKGFGVLLGSCFSH